MRLRGINRVNGTIALWLGILFLLISSSVPALAATETIFYDYYDSGAIQKATYGDGTTIAYVYDDMGNRLTQTVLLFPNISVSPDSLNFGSVNVGLQSPAQTLTITNTGSSDLAVGAITLSGADASEFTKQSDTCSGIAVAPSASCEIQFTFTPASSGPKEATLAIPSNDADTPSIDITLSGTGTSTLTVSVTPASSGTVTGTTINCPGTCSAAYSTAGTTEQLTATPNTGYHFVSWSGDIDSPDNPIDVLMDVNKSVTANFRINTYTISTSADSNGSINCRPNPVDYNTNSTCTIDPNTGYHIASVTVDGESQSATSAYVFNNVTATHTIAVTFAINDTTPPITTATASGYTFGAWTSSGTVNVTLSASDTESGVASGYPKYCVDTTNSCNPLTSGTTLGVTCASGNTCTQYVRYYSRDNADNEEIVKSSTVKQDIQVPTLSVSTLSDSAWTSDGTLNISGDISDDGSGLQGLTINGVATTVNPDNTFSYAVVLAEGPNTITVIATDNDNNAATDIRTINYDPYAPVITIDQPVDNSKTATQVITLSGSVDEYSAVTGVTNNLLPMAFDFTEQDGTFSASAALTYGTNTIEVDASDLSLNTATAKRTIIFDNVAPALSLTNPPQDITTSQAGVDVQGTVSDLTIPTATMTVDGGTPETLAVTTGQFAKTITFTTEKTYVIQVTAVDEAGNTSTVTRNVIYMVDTSPDPFTFTAQSGVALYSAITSNAITVSGINVPAAISITGGTYSINGGAFTSVAETVNNGDTVTVRQTSSGFYSTTSNATLNIGGVSGTFSVTTTANDAPPAITLGACSVVSTTGVATISYTGTDDIGVSRIVLNWGDASIITVTNYSPALTSQSDTKTHSYVTVGRTYTVTGTVTDTIGQVNRTPATATCTYAAPLNYTIGGTVKTSAGVNIASAMVNLTYTKTGTVRQAYSSTSGAYSFANVPDGTAYSITVTKSPYTFPITTGTVSDGNVAANIIAN